MAPTAAAALLYTRPFQGHPYVLTCDLITVMIRLNVFDLYVYSITPNTTVSSAMQARKCPGYDIQAWALDITRVTLARSPPCARSVGAAARYQPSDGEEDEDIEMGDSPACEVGDMAPAPCRHTTSFSMTDR